MAHVMDGPRSQFPLHLCLVLCGLMVSVPFLFPYHYFPFLTCYNEWFAFVIGLAALGAMGLGPSRRAVPLPAMCLGLCACTAGLAFEVALGQVAYPLRSAMGALYSIWGALMVLLGAWLAGELGENTVAHSLQWWLAIAGTLVAASGFLQLYHTPLPASIAMVAQPGKLMFGVIGQSNNFANYLGAALLSVAFLRSRGVLGAAAAALMALLLSTGMALSGSRTSWGYMAVSLVLIPLLLRRDSPEAAGKVLRVPAFAFAGFALVQVLNLYSDLLTGPEGRTPSAGERFARYLHSDNASGEGSIRIQLFFYAWLVFLSNPLFGAGVGEYGLRPLQIAAGLQGPVTRGVYAHSPNRFLQLLAVTGISGFLLVPVRV